MATVLGPMAAPLADALMLPTGDPAAINRRAGRTGTCGSEAHVRKVLHGVAAADATVKHQRGHAQPSELTPGGSLLALLEEAAAGVVVAAEGAAERSPQERAALAVKAFAGHIAAQTDASALDKVLLAWPDGLGRGDAPGCSTARAPLRRGLADAASWAETFEQALDEGDDADSIVLDDELLALTA